MSTLQPIGPANEAENFKILYVGSDPAQVEKILSRVETQVGMRSVSGVADAMKLARTTHVDCIIVDQRRESNQAALLTAALAGEPNVQRIVVLTSPENASAYEALGAKCEVLFYPVKPLAMIDAVFLNKKETELGWRGRVGKSFSLLTKLKRPELTLPFSFSRAVIPLVSFIYKNTALVLLAALFSVFISYGVMIVFFLMSSDWAAPLTLSGGHELVLKTERQISDLRVKKNLIKQKISREQREVDQAKRAYGDAQVLASFVSNTIDSEIGQRLVLQKDSKQQVSRLVVLLKQMKQATSKTGYRRELGRKYEKRLINRQVYNSSLLAMLELQQRKAGVQSELATQRREIAKIAQSIIMLESLRQQIQLPEIKLITAADAEFVPLANQVIIVKTELKNTKTRIVSHYERLSLLHQNGEIVDHGITKMSKTPLARAAKAPITVLFVPYDNGENFQPKQPLYSCRFGITWCRKVGHTGAAVEGEVVSVHPFFGKNLRGSFVEAILTDSEAAKKEVLHVGRPPLFF